ncbi:origin recognition complex subunit 3-like isoform X1 [Sycon ciliatum]|uniref:origin recognition complex subunit 3-like isoform X1 n=2 Tax=Sycon ciliatum TaxID=27933 RepID=UPI0031F6DDA0
MSSTPFISQGSFLFRPTSTKRKKSASSSGSSAGTGFQAFPGEPAQAAKQRFECFQQSYEVVETIFKNLSQLQHRDLVLSLIDCLSRDADPASIARMHCRVDDRSSNGDSTADNQEQDFLRMYKWPTGSQETLHLRTVALSAGANALDHVELFDYLRKRLRKDLTPFVVILSASECTTMKRLLRVLCAAIQEVDESCPDHSTISSLFDWLKEQHYSQNIASAPLPGKKSTGRHGSQAGKDKTSKINDPSLAESRSAVQPVVIVLQEFESFQSQLLDDFLSLCHFYLDRIPFRLVFGLSSSSSSENVSTLLPPGVNQLLAITSFRSAPAATYLATIVEKVLFSAQHSFRLGHQSLALLISHFLHVNHSVAALNQGIKLAMLEHYRSMPLSNLCSPGDCSRRVDLVCHGKKEWDLLRSLPTMKKYIESQEAQCQLNLLQKDVDFKACVISAVQDIQLYHSQLLSALATLHTLFHDLPQPSIGNQIVDIYSNVLRGELMESEGFKNSLRCFKLLSRDDMISRVRSSLTHLSSVPENSALCERCTQLVGKLEQLGTRSLSTSDDLQSARGDECAESSSDARAAAAAGPAAATSSTGNAVSLSTADRRHRLHQRLRSYRSSNTQQTDVTTCVTTLLNEFCDYFRHAVRPPSLLPLSELFYCGAPSARILQQTTLASPRLSVQQALLNPQPILQCTCCEASAQAPSASMPPLSVAYWICTECPRNINLHDWLMSFLSIVKTDAGGSQGKDSIGAKKKKKKAGAASATSAVSVAAVDDKVWQSAFIQSVSELQLLGFIKSTRQKTDHVRRLVWGRC